MSDQASEALSTIDEFGDVGESAARQPREAAGAAVRLVRRDARTALTLDHPVDPLAGLAARERLGPFPAFGGTDVWFDAFPAFGGRVEVRAAGDPVPVVVLTRATIVPVAGPPRIVVEAGGGTVWLRGDCFGDLPGHAFVGMKIAGGELRLAGAA